MRSLTLTLLLFGCGGEQQTTPADHAVEAASPTDGGSGYLLTVSPAQVAARQHLGGPGDPPFVLEFRVPSDLRGGGLPADLYSAASDLSIVQVELPQGRGSTDEDLHASTGLSNFDPPVFCLLGAPLCPVAGTDGFWKATVMARDGSSREVQLAMAMRDVLHPANVYVPAFGVFLPATDTLHAGDRLQLSYVGKMTARSTDWTDQPFTVHFRYRSFGGGAPWTVLDDSQVQPLQIGADAQARYVRALAPLDVQAGVPFTVAVTVTDHFGNPRAIRGIVHLSGGVTADLSFANEWRKELAGVVYANPGSHRIVPRLDGARSVYHYTMAWSGPPPVQRLLGDIHVHSGDGGAQRKFIGTFLPGDHRALYSRTRDSLRYMHEVAGLDFGAVSEHAVRWDAYRPPPAVGADPVFRPGGECAGAGGVIPALDAWWPRQQQIAEEYGNQTAGSFLVFPAFEWHAAHSVPGDRSLLHRVVLFRDFAAGALPILPGDVENLPPQCLIRFLADAGFTPDRALVVPHMMRARDNNIDWDLTYAASSVATRAQMERYHRIGEIYSARAVDQDRPYGKATLTVFEGADQAAGPWSYRYGWKNLAAHIGLIGSSDNHEQMPGVNDDLDLDGVNYHANEPGGYAAVLAVSPDRDGVYQALRARRTYATSGVRAWLAFNIDGLSMGSEIPRAAASVDAHIGLMVGMTIARVELWAVRVGAAQREYQLVRADLPFAETFSTNLTLDNPVPAGGAPQEWLYYVRAFLSTPGSPNDVDEAVWSSPIWITWSR